MMMNQSLHIFIDTPDSRFRHSMLVKDDQFGDWMTFLLSQFSKPVRQLGAELDPWEHSEHWYSQWTLFWASFPKGAEKTKWSQVTEAVVEDDNKMTASHQPMLRQLTVASLTCMAVSVAKVPTSFLSSKSQVIGWWDCVRMTGGLGRQMYLR